MSVLELTYGSALLGKPAQAMVLYPGTAQKGPFPVLFLLHGMFGCHRDWLEKSRISLAVEDLPLIVVMPNGERSFYADAVQGFPFGRWLGEELPGVIESTFHTKLPWCVTGLSMGGYGALRLALTYPQRFRSVASHSGALHFTQVPFGHDEPTEAEFARIAGPSPIGSPNDLFHLSRTIGKVARPRIWVDCGVDDHLLEANRSFHEHLLEVGYDHSYSEYPGAHDWEYWDAHVHDSLAFHLV